MLTISSKSWHLRLVRFLYGPGYVPSNLCEYFRHCVASIFVVAIYGLLVFVTLPISATVFFFTRGEGSLRTRMFTTTFTTSLIIVVGMIAVLLIVAILAGLWLKALLLLLLGVVLGLFGLLVVWAGVLILMGVRTRWLQKRGHTLTKEPNLLLEWVKAKKQKVCPLISLGHSPDDGLDR